MWFRRLDRVHLIVWPFFLIFWASGAVSYGLDRASLLQKAREAAQAKNYERATEIYDRLLEDQPGNLEALTGKARVLSWMGRYGPAEQIYKSVLEKNPDHFDATTGLADLYAWQGKTPESISLLEGLEASYPHEREVLIRLARYHLWAAHKREAIRYADEVLEDEPADKEAKDLREKAKEIYRFEGYAGGYYLDINDNVDGRNVYVGLRYLHNKRIKAYAQFDYLDRFNQIDERFLAGLSIPLRDKLRISAELSLTPDAEIFPSFATRAELAYVARPRWVLYSALNFSNYTDVKVYGISVASEYYPLGDLSFLSGVSVSRTDFEGAGNSTDGALLLKMTKYFGENDRVFAYFSYGNEAYLISTIDKIGDIQAKTYGLGGTYFISPLIGLTPTFEYQDRGGGTRYLQFGLEMVYRW